MKLIKIICLIAYYGFAYYLPNSYSLGIIGRFSNVIRVFLCKRIFKNAGNITTINRCAYFGSGKDVEIGDYSGIGANAEIPSNCKIGKYVMMAPNCRILNMNHVFSDTTKPMCFQGYTECHPTVIEDDVWIGRDVLILPGRHIRMGCILAAGCVLCKDFPEFSIIGGNPSRLIKSRYQEGAVKE